MHASEDLCCHEYFNHAWLRTLTKENEGHTGSCFLLWQLRCIDPRTGV
jgi:hypothetical protein